MEAPPYAFDRRLFTDIREINEYVAQQSQAAAKERSIWRNVLKEPLDSLVSTLDLAFTKAEPKLGSYWEFAENSKVGLPDVWTRSVLLSRTVGNKPYTIEISDSRSENDIERIEIRIRYPVGRTAPPYEWEVYTLNMGRVVGREDHIWLNSPPGSDNYVSSGISLPIPAAPLLSLQASDGPRPRLDKIAIGTPTPSGDQVFDNPEDAGKILREGLRQVLAAINDPGTVFEAFEPHEFGGK